MKRHVVFDLETTGFQHSEGHRIVEIGAVEVLDGRPTENTFHVYVNPDREVPEDAVKVHGLTSEFLSDKPLFNDARVAKSFLNFISGATLIAHNGKAFDLPFLNDELAANNLGVVDNELIDTLIMARKKYPGSPASLDALCSRFGIDTSEREAEGHGALLDSILLCKVYLELMGGAQGDLQLKAFSSRNELSFEFEGKFERQRPVSLTQIERVEHKAFLEMLGKDSVWKEFKNLIN